MKNLSFKCKCAFLALFFAFSLAPAVNAQKISALELIAKHLESIGTKEKRNELKNRFLFTDVQMVIKGTPTQLNGRGLVLSEGEKNLWGINFASNDYPQERFGFDGKDTKVGFSRPGTRSTLGGFIYSYPELLDQSILGGGLLSSWALSDANIKNAKVSTDGTKKIDGKETYVLSYMPKGGSDLTIKMYFDQKNFRHLRTEYNRVVAARQGGGIDNSAGQSADRYRLIENFSNYEDMGGLMLPRTYKLSYAYTGSSSVQLAANANRELEFTFTITKFAYNQKIDNTTFDLSGK